MPFLSVFTGKTCIQEFYASEIREKVWSGKDLSLVEEEKIRDYLNKKDIPWRLWSIHS